MKYIYFFIPFLLVLTANAQDEKNVVTRNIEVGYDKTTFIVFGSEVDFLT